VWLNAASPGSDQGSRYGVYSAEALAALPAIRALGPEWVAGLKAAAAVLPTKVSTYAVEQLIDWDNLPDDPLFVSLVPQPEMLEPDQRERVQTALRSGDSRWIHEVAATVRRELNPHPSDQLAFVPALPRGGHEGGMQHKYEETALLFPQHGQTCHAYCTFCFRFPQFTSSRDGLHRFSTNEMDSVVEYLSAHEEVTDVLITGGDPMVMSSAVLRRYVAPLLTDALTHIRSIRFGTRALSFWPYRFLDDPESSDLLEVLSEVVAAGKHVAMMAHVLHPRELDTDAAVRAVRAVQGTGAVIRAQAPLMRKINDDPAVWTELWRRQVSLGIVPYYMFLARDTGPHRFFAVPLLRAWKIFAEAASGVSGLARTVRGPCMSTSYGKIEVLGPAIVGSEEVLALRMVQGREPAWTYRPFFAAMDGQASWLDELRPAFGEDQFFFEAGARRSAVVGR
jgi:L-lysine 2,3-aminomutase